MGVGKSTIGKKLAHKLEYNFIDIDDLFENRFKISVSSFFDKYGENLFRELENKLLKETYKLKNTVVSCGGGTPCFFDAMDEINKHGLSIYLYMPIEAIANRLENAIRPRPLVKEKNHAEIIDEIQHLWDKRELFYEKSKLKYNAINPNIDEVINLIA